MPMTSPAFQAMSVEDYLRSEETSPVKREYVNGFVYAVDNGEGVLAQAGSSKPHAEIIMNMMEVLRPVARRQGCRAFASEIKLRLDGQNSFYYPDVMVACGPEPRDQYAETVPCLLVEVLSRGTANIDRHAKYAAYTAIPSLQTYLIAEQTERRVYACGREGERWKLTEYVGEGVIALPCLGMELSLEEIYAGVVK